MSDSEDNEGKTTEKGLKDDEDLFYFESDHLALRGNKDYSEMLKTMFVLEAQRQKAIEDFNHIVEIRDECLENPLSCVEKLKNGTLGIPDMLHIADIPNINWSKYNTKVPDQYIKMLNMEKCNGQTSSNLEFKDPSVPKPWTIEEQRKLDELLIKYPPEEVEHSRIKKIARELGTRTKTQVASRLQKYYLKLLKAGLPIPGKLPKSKTFEKYSKIKQKKFVPSTFFPELTIPVAMNEMEDIPGPSTSGLKPETSSNYLLSNNYHEEKLPETQRNEVDLQLSLVKMVKDEKLLEQTSPVYFHHGFTCDYCEEDTIQGSRWHCSTCISESVDFCTDCMLSQLYSSKPHNLHHKFIIVRNDKHIIEPAYSESESSVKNYGELSDNSEQSDGDESEAKMKSDNESDLFDSHSSNKYKLELSDTCPANIFDSVNGAEYNEDDTFSNGSFNNLLLNNS